MSVVCMALSVALFASTVWLWLLADQDVWRHLTTDVLRDMNVYSVDGPKRLIGFGLIMVPLSFTVLALVRLSGVFRRYSRGEIFSQSTADGLAAVGVWATAAVVAKLVMMPAMSVAMTYDNPPGERMLSIALSSNDFIFLVIAVTFLVLAWVMSEARRISDDLSQIV